MRWEFLSLPGFQVSRLSNWQTHLICLMMAFKSSLQWSQLHRAALTLLPFLVLPLAKETFIHSFVDANGNSHLQVRHPITVNRIRTKKYTKTRPCKRCGDGDLRKLTRFFCHLCKLSFCCPNAFGNQDGFLDHVQSIRHSRGVASLVEGVWRGGFLVAGCTVKNCQMCALGITTFPSSLIIKLKNI